MVDPTEAKILSRAKSNWHRSNNTWPRSNNTWHRLQSTASNDTLPPPVVPEKCSGVQYLQDHHTPNTKVMDDDIKWVSIETMRPTEAETDTPPPPVSTSITPQSNIVPMLESNYMPQMPELERDMRKYHKLYPEHTGPQLVLGQSISNSEEEYFHKEVAVNYARNLAIGQLPCNLITILDDSDSELCNETDESTEIISTNTPNQEQAHLYAFSMGVLKCQQVTLNFVQENQTWNKIKCPCSGSMVGWMHDNHCVINRHSTERCTGTTFTPQGFLNHCIAQSSSSYHQYFLMHYLKKLYCTDTGIVRPCLPNPVPRSVSNNLMILNILRWVSLLGYMQSDMNPLSDSSNVSDTSSSDESDTSSSDERPLSDPHCQNR